MKKVKTTEVTDIGLEVITYWQEKVILGGKVCKIRCRADEPKSRKKLKKMINEITRLQNEMFPTEGVGKPVEGKDFRKWSRQLGWDG